MFSAVLLSHLDLEHFLTVLISHVYGTGNARVKAVDGSQYLDRLHGIMELMIILQGGLIGAGIAC